MKDDDQKGPETVRVPRPVIAPPRPAGRWPIAKPAPELARPQTGPAIDVHAREAAAEAKRRASKTEEEVEDALEGAKRHNEGLEREIRDARAELRDVRAGVLVVARAIGTDKQLPEGLRRSMPPPALDAPRPTPTLEARARVTERTNYVQLAILVLYFLLEVLSRAGFIPPPPALPAQNPPIQQR